MSGRPESRAQPVACDVLTGRAESVRIRKSSSGRQGPSRDSELPVSGRCSAIGRVAAGELPDDAQRFRHAVGPSGSAYAGSGPSGARRPGVVGAGPSVGQ